MWSRRFLWAGVTSGVAIAALALAALWLALFLGSGSKDPAWTWANITQFATPGLIVYSACWYAVIFRARDYSWRRTLQLVAATYIAVCLIVAVLLMLGGLYVAVSTLMVTPSWKLVPIIVVAPLAYAFLTVFGAALLAIPYSIIAAPAAFLHRWLLLTAFAATLPGSFTPLPGTPE